MRVIVAIKYSCYDCVDGKTNSSSAHQNIFISQVVFLLLIPSAYSGQNLLIFLTDAYFTVWFRRRGYRFHCYSNKQKRVVTCIFNAREILNYKNVHEKGNDLWICSSLLYHLKSDIHTYCFCIDWPKNTNIILVKL
jgi:hypothetical protein